MATGRTAQAAHRLGLQPLSVAVLAEKIHNFNEDPPLAGGAQRPGTSGTSHSDSPQGDTNQPARTGILITPHPQPNFRDSARIFRLTLFFFLPLFTIVLGVGTALFLARTGSEGEALRDVEWQVVETLREQLRYDTKTAAADLRFLAHRHVMNTIFLTNDPAQQASKEELLEDFLHLCEAKETYTHVRLLNATGREMIRVNCGQDHAEVVPDEELQDKGQRYYFRDALALEPHQIYVSPIDLVVEHDEIKRPIVPTIRFAAPIFDANGHKRGVVVLNYPADKMLQGFHTHSHPDIAQVMLVNRDGYWLKGPHPEEEWGFMLDDRRDKTIQAAYPDVWEKMQQSPSGQLETPAGLFTYATAYPLGEGMASSSGDTAPNVQGNRPLSAEEYHWQIVSLVPHRVLISENRFWLHSTMLAIGVITLLLGFISWRLARARVLRDRTEADLLHAKEEWERTFDSVPEAIALIDPKHRIIRANKALADQAGLAPAECVGKTCHSLLHGLTVPPSDCPHSQVMTDGTPHTLEFFHPGANRFFHVTASPLFSSDGELMGSVHVARDITQRKQAEVAIKDAHQRLLTVLDSLDALVYVIDMKNLEILFLNRYAKDIFGDVTGMVCWQAIQTNQTGPCSFCPNDTLRQGRTESDSPHIWEIYNQRNQRWYENRDRAITWLDGRLVKIQIATDITQRKASEKKLRQYAETQQVLLREVNHRVKNNLAAIISMLHKEEDRAAGDQKTESVSLLHDLEGRILGLSTVHSLLSEHAWQPLPLAELCERVARAAIQTVPLTHTVELTVTPSSLKVESSQAHHLALVVNELVTNSVKHSMTDRQQGRVAIAIAQEEQEMVRLIFRDDGPGFPAAILAGDFSNTHIGFDLLNGIVKRSLRGSIVFSNDNGAVTTIRFHNPITAENREKNHA